MSQMDSMPSREDILYSFAVEEGHDAALLKTYQLRFPELADELLSLYHELLEGELDEEGPETAAEAVAIEAAWNRYVQPKAVPQGNPFAALSIPQQQNVARLVGVPQQVLSALRDGRVAFATVPQRFLKRLAAAMKQPLGQLTSYFAAPAPMGLAKSYKSSAKPILREPVSFEQILIDARLSDDQRAELLREDD